MNIITIIDNYLSNRLYMMLQIYSQSNNIKVIEKSITVG